MYVCMYVQMKTFIHACISKVHPVVYRYVCTYLCMYVRASHDIHSCVYCHINLRWVAQSWRTSVQYGTRIYACTCQHTHVGRHMVCQSRAPHSHARTRASIQPHTACMYSHIDVYDPFRIVLARIRHVREGNLGDADVNSVGERALWDVRVGSR